MAEMLAVPSTAAALLHPVVFRQGQRRLTDDAGNGFQPLRTQRRGIDGDTGIDQAALAVIDGKHLAGESPEFVDRRLRTGVAFLGAVAEADDPFGRVPDMIGTFLFRL